MYRILCTLIVARCGIAYAAQAPHCERLNKSEIVYFEGTDFRGTALYDAQRKTLTSVSHNMDELRPRNGYANCFGVYDAFGQTLLTNVKLGHQKENLELSSSSRKGPFSCQGYSHFAIADLRLRNILFHDIQTRFKHGIDIRRHSSLSPSAGTDAALLMSFQPYLDQLEDREAAGFLNNFDSIAVSADQISPDTQLILLESTFARFKTIVPEIRTDFNGEWLACDGWYGASGSPVVDREGCLVGMLDQLDPGAAYWFRAFAPIGLIKMTTLLEREKLVPCAS